MTEFIFLGVFIFWISGILLYKYENRELTEKEKKEIIINAKCVMDSIIANEIWKKREKKSFLSKFF